MGEIIEKLNLPNKFLDNTYKNNNYYREYLDKVNKDLKEETYK